MAEADLLNFKPQLHQLQPLVRIRALASTMADTTMAHCM